MKKIPYRERNGKFQFRIFSKPHFGSSPYAFTTENLVAGKQKYTYLKSELEQGNIPDECLELHQKLLNKQVIRFHDLMLRYMRDGDKVTRGDQRNFSSDLDRFDNVPVSQIDDEWIRDYLDVSKITYNLVPGTIAKHITSFRKMFKWAIKEKIIDMKNPFDGLDNGYADYHPRHEKAGAKTKEDTSRDERIGYDGEAKVLRYMEDPKSIKGMKRRAASRLFFIMAIECGGRLSELFRLSRKWIDLEKEEIRFPAHITKNGNERKVPMTDRLIAEYKLYIEKVEAQTDGMLGFHFPHNLVFPWYERDPEHIPKGFKEKDIYKTYLEKISKNVSHNANAIHGRAGVPHITFHDLRHECLSRMAESGLYNEFDLMRVSGHSDSKQLQRYLNKLDSSAMKEKMKIDAAMRISKIEQAANDADSKTNTG